MQKIYEELGGDSLDARTCANQYVEVVKNIAKMMEKDWGVVPNDGNKFIMEMMGGMRDALLVGQKDISLSKSLTRVKWTRENSLILTRDVGRELGIDLGLVKVSGCVMLTTHDSVYKPETDNFSPLASLKRGLVPFEDMIPPSKLKPEG